MEYSDYLDKLMLKANEKWFKYYARIPLVVSILVGLFFFIWGFVDITNHQEIILKEIDGEMVKVWLYGFLKVETRIGGAIIWWVMGIVPSVGGYFLLKIIFSPHILNVLYLRKIKQDLDKLVFTKEVKEGLQGINNEEWICVKCGTKNSYAAKSCTNCLEKKP